MLSWTYRGGGKTVTHAMSNIFICIEIAFVKKCMRFKTNMKNSKGLKKLYWSFRFSVINKKYIKRYE